MFNAMNICIVPMLGLFRREAWRIILKISRTKTIHLLRNSFDTGTQCQICKAGKCIFLFILGKWKTSFRQVKHLSLNEKLYFVNM